MAFFDAELSLFKSQPIELYKFTDFRYNTYLFTSSDKTTFFKGEEYTPAFIERESIKQAGELTKNDLKVTLTKQNPIVPQLFEILYPKTSVELTIFRFQPEEEDFAQIFKGTVVDPKFIDSKRVEINCQNITRTARKRPADILLNTTATTVSILLYAD